MQGDQQLARRRQEGRRRKVFPCKVMRHAPISLQIQRKQFGAGADQQPCFSISLRCVSALQIPFTVSDCRTETLFTADQKRASSSELSLPALAQINEPRHLPGAGIRRFRPDYRMVPDGVIVGEALLQSDLLQVLSLRRRDASLSSSYSYCLSSMRRRTSAASRTIGTSSFASTGSASRSALDSGA